jgi:hypothetical protein
MLICQLLAVRSESVRERSGERSQAAVRARRWREKRAETQDKSGMAGQQVADGATRSESVRERSGERSEPLILSSLPLEKRTFEEVRKEEITEKRARTKRKPAIPLPDDWGPKEGHYAAASRLGCPAYFVDDKAEDLRIWARSNDARKQDWDQTFHGFLRRDASNWKSKHATTGNGGKSNTWQGARDDFRAARADLKAGIAAAESGSASSGESGGPPIRLVTAAGRG